MDRRLVLVLGFLFTACAGVSPQRHPASDSPTQSFPQIKSDDGKLHRALQKLIKTSVKGLPTADADAATEKLKQYLLFLGLSEKDCNVANKDTPEVEQGPLPAGDAEEAGEGDAPAIPSNLLAVKRLFNSSLQFLYCPDFRDWTCLEKMPLPKPRAKYRQETVAGLGDPIAAGHSLDMDFFFTKAWDGKSSVAGVANRLAERITNDATQSLSIAMYGIDDIGGTMKPVYDAILSANAKTKGNVRAVVDLAGVENGKGLPWILDYTKPSDSALDTRWLFAVSPANPAELHAKFQYAETPTCMSELNRNAANPVEAKVRLEWPAANIMHNKFAVLESQDGHRSVWSGTANLSNHCMGSEANSNMSIYIRNDLVAQAFLDEFNLMFNYDPSLKIRSRLVTGINNNFLVGRFHHNKYPVSHRLFTFEDGTKVRVHFAPTDDAEHRVILPMLLSAQAGDEIRISMFGGTGFEIVRALQYAIAKGANVRIVFDARLGHGQTSWIRDPRLNLTQENPYINVVDRGGTAPGALEVRTSTWPGKNHYKVGTLTRKQADGSYIAEELIIGSQNWSSGGNDENDENLVSIQNLSQSIPAAQAFNEEFDTHLWVNSRTEVRR